MKSFLKTSLLLAIAVFLLPLPAKSSETVVALGEQTILLEAMRRVPDFDYEAQARIMLRAKGTRLPEDDLTEEQQAQLREMVDDLRESVDEIDEETLWRVSRPTRVLGFDVDAGTIELVPLLEQNTPIGFRQPRYKEQLAEGYFLTVVNHDVQQHVEVASDRIEEVGAVLRRSRTISVDVDLRIVELAEQRHFLAVVQRVTVKPRSQKEVPALAVWENPQSPRATLAASPHREGMTLGLAPNHHLELAGGRLLDPLTTGQPGQECEEAGRYDDHLVVACTIGARMGGVALDVSQTFIGGQMVQARYTLRSDGQDLMRPTLEGYLARTLDRRGAELAWVSRDGWTASYDPEAWASSDESATLLTVTANTPLFQFDPARLRKN